MKSDKDQGREWNAIRVRATRMRIMRIKMRIKIN